MPERKIIVTYKPTEPHLTQEDLKGLVEFNIKQIQERALRSINAKEIIYWQDEITRIKQELKAELNRYNN